MPTNTKNHWEQVYATKQPTEVSWTQAIPQTSLDFIHSLKLPKTASIIDIGGGDSKLVDFLLDEGYNNVTVLDISETGIQRAKIRLGVNAKKVNWIVSDVTKFHPAQTYDVWHDRAAFHFLTTREQIAQYLAIARTVAQYVIIGTFSDRGPAKCSGLEIKQYSEDALEKQLLQGGFKKLKCLSQDHITPFNTFQNFLFCSFQKV